METHHRMTLETTHIGATLVTGGAGAIGSRLVRRLLADGAERVVVVDDLSSGYPWLLPEDDRVTLVSRDVCDLFTPDIEIETPLVFHLAAFFANQNSVDHPLDDLHTNGRGTLTTLMWAAAKQARRLVYASAGCSIAGHGLNAPIREDMPVSLFLDTPYQITKALGEFYCNYYLPQVSTVRCRFFNSYGPGEVPGGYRNVIPNFIWRALNGLPLVITGTGEETRDFIFVDDLVDGLVRSATFPQAHGQALNLGTGIQTRIIDLAETIIRACKSQSKIEYAPRRNWDHSLRREADISNARNVLGLSPSVKLGEGIERTVEWFHANRERIEAEMSLTQPVSQAVVQGSAQAQQEKVAA
jgi:UDP-glucose 4-epimerase